MDFHPRLEQPPKSQLQSPLSLPKNRQPNLAFLSGRLTSSSDLALSRSSSVQRFYGDVIAITSWAPDVVNFSAPHMRMRAMYSTVTTQTLSREKTCPIPEQSYFEVATESIVVGLLILLAVILL